MRGSSLAVNCIFLAAVGRLLMRIRIIRQIMWNKKKDKETIQMDRDETL